MIARGIRLTGLRREVLSALAPGQGVSFDELKRRVATARGLVPSSPGWPAYAVSFARACRLLEEKGALEVAREAVFFQKPCASWVKLTEQGERDRERVLERSEHGLGALAPEPGRDELDHLREVLARLSESDLARIGYARLPGRGIP